MMVDEEAFWVKIKLLNAARVSRKREDKRAAHRIKAVSCNLHPALPPPPVVPAAGGLQQAVPSQRLLAGLPACLPKYLRPQHVNRKTW